jgi:hypothetical protein
MLRQSKPISSEEVKEDEIGDLKDNEQRRDVYPGNAGELNWRQIERCSIQRKQDSACEKKANPPSEGRMMQSNSESGIARCLKNSSRQHEQKYLHF